MGLFSWWPGRGRKSADGTLDLFREVFGYPESRSGQMVTWATAIQVVTVLACVRVLANGVAQVPWKTFRERADGGSNPAKDHWAYKLLHIAPNGLQTSFEYRQQMMLHLLLAGVHYSLKIRVGDEVRELLPLQPHWVTKRIHEDWTITYRVQIPKRAAFEVSARDMWHLRGLSWDICESLEPVKLVREAVGLAMSAEEHVARTLKNGGNVNGVLESTAPNLSEQQVKDIRKQWEETYSGASNAGKTVILNNMKFAATAMKLVDAEMLAERKFQVEQICQAWGVYPQVIGVGDKAPTYASAEQFFGAHVVLSLMPWYELIDQSVKKNVIGVDEDVYAKLLPNGLMRGSSKDRADFYSKMYGIGALNPNEIRALEEMNPYPGGEKYRVPLNMADPNEEPTPEGDTDKPTDGDKPDA